MVGKITGENKANSAGTNGVDSLLRLRKEEPGLLLGGPTSQESQPQRQKKLPTTEQHLPNVTIIKATHLS